MIDNSELLAKVCRAVQRASDRHLKPKATHRLVDDLGFDSLGMATLAVALEGELGHALLLNDWIAMAADPSHLTIQSLTDYLATALVGEC